MIGRDLYFYPELKDMDNKEILSGFVKQYYMDNPNIPNRIMMREEIEDKDAVEQWLSTILEKIVEIKTPKKGEKLRFVEMAENNAKVTLENKEKDKSEILLEIKEVCKLDKLPRKIETYDISNISGEYMVAGMCVLKDGAIKKNLSRRFKIKTVYEQDDPKCMEEVITRRLKHSIENPKGGFGELPDAIFADGGITQIRATKRAIEKYNLNIIRLMKEGIFSFIWAGICALLSVWLVLYVDAKIGFSNDYFFPTIVDAINDFGWSVRKVLFFSLYLVYWVTGIHK